MANLEKLAANYRSEGYSALLAEARVCQDSKAELPAVFEQVKERYVLDRPRMIRYARRRNKASEISRYLKGDSDDA